MKTPHEIIQRPIITEKGVEIKELQRTLVFQVALGATKPEIKRAVEQVFGVKVS
ncbi:MAG: 50S ribosomal protein L23, partial [Acidobacteria bacterium]|nr:50S ribosomal protein L23 [Acidobacteriota bacterium]